MHFLVNFFFFTNYFSSFISDIWSSARRPREKSVRENLERSHRACCGLVISGPSFTSALASLRATRSETLLAVAKVRELSAMLRRVYGGSPRLLGFFVALSKAADGATPRKHEENYAPRGNPRGADSFFTLLAFSPEAEKKR